MSPVPPAYDADDPAVVSAIDDLPLWAAPFGLALLDAVKLRPDLRALDVGSGLGFPSVELAQRLGATGLVAGLDPWRAAVRRARAKVAAWGLDNAFFVEGFAERMPFADASFDLVVSNNGLNNVQDDAQACREIHRVARRGAQVLLTMNLPETMHEFYGVLREVLVARGMRDRVQAVADHIHRKRKPREHVERILAAAGLEVAGVKHDSFDLRWADGTAMLDSPVIRLAFRPSWEAVLEPGDVEPVFADVAAELDRRAAAAGGTTLSVPWILVEARRT